MARYKHSNKARQERRVRTQRQARGIAREQGATWETGGRHPKIRRNGVGVPCPAHGNREYPMGTGKSIFKMLVSAGILFIIFSLVVFMAYGEVLAG